MLIRDATGSDAEQILQIYEPFVLETAVSFEMNPPSLAAMKRRIKAASLHWPWLVQLEDQQICGYAYARPFRDREAYQFTAETTVYVRQGSQRRGIGFRLMSELMSRLKANDFHRVVAGITLPNTGSVALHERLGFKSAGTFPEVGRKFDKWHDVGFWTLDLPKAHFPNAVAVDTVKAP